MYSKRGFSLVELMVVIAILGLLAAMLLPALGRSRDRARHASCLNNLRQLGMAFAMFQHEHNDYFPYPAAAYPVDNDPVGYDPAKPADDPAQDYFLWLWMGRGFRKVLTDYLPGDKEDPSIYYCPSDLREGYDYTSYAYSMAFYHSPEQINTLIGKADARKYLYAGNNPAYIMPTIKQTSAAVQYPSKKILLGEWYSNHEAWSQDPGWWGTGGRRNFLFADGHVESVRAADILPAADGLPNPCLTVDGIAGRDIL